MDPFAPRTASARAVLGLLRRDGPLPGAEIARRSGLSAQTASVTLRELQADGLVSRGERQRGRVGQPSVPMALAAGGAFFLGLKIGRRSNEMLLMDFAGAVRGRRMRRHDWPDPETALTFATLAAGELVAQLGEAERPRLAGLGIAMPFRLWDWAARLGAPEGLLEQWRHLDLRAALAARLPLPCYLQNDATAAAMAEQVLGRADLPADFVHAYVGFFVGGGVVLGGRLYRGATGHAGALGSLPVRGAAQATGGGQLIDCASTAVLERALMAAGLPPERLWAAPEGWDIPDRLLDPWLAGAAEGLAQAAVAAVAMLDVAALVIDGWMPAGLRTRLVEQTRAALARQDLSGLEAPAVIEGTLGADARALGAACLPLAARFLADPG